MRASSRAFHGEGFHRVPAQGEGAGLVQAGQDRGDVQQEVAGAGETDKRDSWGCLGSCVSGWSWGGGGGLPHVHGEYLHDVSHGDDVVPGDERGAEDQQPDGDQLHAGGVQR